MKKGGSSESTIIIGPSKSVLVYALARFRVFVPKLLSAKLFTTLEGHSAINSFVAF